MKFRIRGDTSTRYEVANVHVKGDKSLFNENWVMSDPQSKRNNLYMGKYVFVMIYKCANRIKSFLKGKQGYIQGPNIYTYADEMNLSKVPL